MRETRVIVISGKGGVGKTTVACATAVAAADRGHRTLVVSLDRAHNLGDVLGMQLDSSVTPVPGCANMEALEIDPQAQLDNSSSVLRAYMERFISYLGPNGVMAKEMAVFPGLEELLVLTRLAELAESGQYDLIVTDMAPTASSIRYLSFPDMMEGMLGKMVTWEQRLAHLLRPFQGKHLKLPVPENEVYDSLRHLAAKLSRLKKLLQDPQRTVVRLVMVPESIVLEETRRALTYMSLFGLAVDSVIVNRIFPQTVVDGYFKNWREVQTRVLNQAKESLPELPILTLEFQPEEVLSVVSLRRSAGELYGLADPLEFRHTKPPLAYTRDGEATVLVIKLPHARGDGLDLRQRGGELTVTVHGWRRNILLPEFLIGQSVTKARFAEGQLLVRFEPAPAMSVSGPDR